MRLRLTVGLSKIQYYNTTRGGFMTTKSAVQIKTGSIIPMLTVDDAIKAIDFYVRAFGAEEVMCMRGPENKVMHAELKLQNGNIFLNDEFPDMGCRSPKSSGTPGSKMHIYVDNVDQFVEKAVAAGATLTMPVTDMFWGDRNGTVTDPFGHIWSIATRVKDLTAEEIKKGQESWMKEFAQKSRNC
jgi:PhnB protein